MTKHTSPGCMRLRTAARINASLPVDSSWRCDFAEPRSIKEEPTTLIPTTEDFWREKPNKKDIYPVTREKYKNLVALLINNKKFTLKHLNRRGAEEDAEKLLKDLGYEVVKYTDLTAKAIDEALFKFSEHPKLQGTDNVIVVLMSHGKLGTILGVDWTPKATPLETSKSDDKEPDEFPIRNIYKHLGPEKCPALLNKTKIHIIQASRGDNSHPEEGAVLVSDCGPDEIRNQEISPYCWYRFDQIEENFISFHACTPDTKAYRDTVRGSLLIQFIVDVFNTHAYEDDIEKLFRKVMRRFEEYRPSNIRQMPIMDRSTLTRSFYFYPGLNIV
ncbi:caspase a-like [Limanda limanda]|uniref:caspase a-like n=1 Tax=Limanda limanda TaxID=27771 RepID=UPI0029C78659|nr:caspase a-like [Limanda limanda]